MSEIRRGYVTQVALDTREEIEWAGERGLDFVEFLMDGDLRRGRMAEREAELTDLLAASGLDALVHLPFPVDVGSPFDPVREGWVAELEACLETAAALGAEKAVLHPESRAWSVTWPDERVRPNVVESVQSLVEFGAARDVEVCVENLFDSTYTIRSIDDLLEETDASMTLDTGHARIEGFSSADTAAFVADHRDRVSHVHLNDTRGPSDEHLPFGAGDVDFDAVLDPLRSDWEGTLSLEVSSPSFAYLSESVARLDDLL